MSKADSIFFRGGGAHCFSKAPECSMIFFLNPRRLIALAFLGTVLGVLPLGIPSLSAKTKVDADKIYYGDARKFSRPAVVDAVKVYRQIPAHKELIERKLTRNDPDYWPLMRKASQSFSRALRKVCQDKRYDLVGEVDTIAIDDHAVPEITSEVIASLADKPRSGKEDGKPAVASPQDPPAKTPAP